MDIDGHVDSPFDATVYSGLADPLFAKHGTGSPPLLSSARALPSSAGSPLGRTPLSPPRPPAACHPSTAALTRRRYVGTVREPPLALQRRSVDATPRGGEDRPGPYSRPRALRDVCSTSLCVSLQGAWPT